jgi:MoCo/4Fe-4S cofactor protein with predicted Tat translocation signal
MPSTKGSKAKCGAAPAAKAGPSRLDLAAVRERLAAIGGRGGPELWRSLDELAETPEFVELLHREFPRHAAEWLDEPGDSGNPGDPGDSSQGGVSRRAFFQLAGASLALAGLTGCTRQPLEDIVPYVHQPEQVVPGRALYFATTLTLGGYGTGVLAESHEGRPTKVEGNPDHPASLGSTDMFAQAAVLDLYDPARSQAILHLGQVAAWSGFMAEMSQLLRAREKLGGQGVRVLSGTVTSPSLAAQMQELSRRLPAARWHRWEPAGRHNTRAAAARAFGRPLDCRYDLSRADVLLTVDSDLFAMGPGSVAYARQFADRRRVREASPDLAQKMNRLYTVESTPTSSAGVADHRLQLSPLEIEAFLVALARELGVTAAGVAASSGAAAPAGATAPASAAAPSDTAGGSPAGPAAQRFLHAVAQDLRAHAGASLVVVDESLSPAAQVLGHAINEALRNAGATVFYSAPVEADPVDHLQSIGELVRDMNAGQVEVLILLGGSNPVYTAPAELDFTAALKKVALRVHHGHYADETAEFCHWHIPAAHELESWGDARAFDGTASIAQPLIEPLFGGKTAQEVMAVLVGTSELSAFDLVRSFWRGSGKLGGNFDAAWRKALHDGVIPGTAEPPAAPPPLAAAAVTQAAGEIEAAAAKLRQAPGQITLAFRPDPTIFDGRYAANAWLQELPKPATKLTWDNAVLVSPATAQRLKLGVNQRVQLSWKGRKLDAAVWTLPGQADDTATLSLGYGRSQAGPRGTGLGFNAYALRTSDAAWIAPGAGLQTLPGDYVFACTQNHHVIEMSAGISEDVLAGKEAQARHVIRTGTVAEFVKNPEFVREMSETPPREMTLYPNRVYSGHAWAMAIDLNTCTGCSACVVACQAENNVPVVGKEQVLKHREMQWIRVDRYFSGDVDNPQFHNQPVPCMQCENAPCEVVCPVAATIHSDEGLNDMVYNRCVGTRYCSNNCPYKVRRFNFLRYSEKSSPLLAMLQNPDVTVRMRGVMEKCTYCVQRIEHAKIDSKVSGQPVAEQRLMTACQQACPTRAISFGDLNGEQQTGRAWEVVRLKASPLNYAMRGDLNTRPRTTYLARVRNANPQLEASHPAAAAQESS